MRKFHIALLFCCISFASAGQTLQWALLDTPTSEPFNDGLACFQDKETKLYGAIDRSGQVAVKPLFRHSFTFEEGYAVVSDTSKLYGVINIYGHYILDPIYKSIDKRKEAAGLYQVTAPDGGRGLFFNNRLVIPAEYQYIIPYDFPLIGFSKPNEKSRYINLFDGEIFENVISYGTQIRRGIRAGGDIYYALDGKAVDVEQQAVSSKGVTYFRDEQTQMYGFMNKQTGEIITEAKYTRLFVPFFIYDRMIVPQGDYYVLIGADGREVIPSGKFKYMGFIDEKVLSVSATPVGDGTKFGLYSMDGKEILPCKEIGISYYADGWVKIPCTPEFTPIDYYHYPSGRRITGYNYWEDSADGMAQTVKKVNGNYRRGFVNLKTLKEIPAIYEDAKNFSEGLALVRKDGNRLLINELGTVVLKDDDKISVYGEASEGVIAVWDKASFSNGYVYNPSRKSEYIYNQSNEASEKTIQSWFAKGNEYFGRNDYVQAKEHYYKVMMVSPYNTDVIVAYGACLSNMGYYEEALESYQIVLDIDPDHKIAQDNVANTKRNIQLREQQAMQQQIQQPRSRTFWDALNSFCTMAYSVMETYNSFNSGGSYGGGDVPSGQSCSYYQSRYNELKAKRDAAASGNAGRAGTAAGKNAAHSISPRHASAATSGDYKVINSANALIREYDRQMESVKRQARQAGCSVY